MTPSLSRRVFLSAAAAGAAAGAFSLGFHIPAADAAPGPIPGAAPDAAPEINAWVVIRPDDAVILRVARAEMGQGALTGLAQLIAEELACDWSKVRFELVAPGENRRRQRVWRDMSTGGSRSIRQSHEYLRTAGAAARIMLVQAAAQRWKVPVRECAAANGVVTHARSKRSLRYGALAADAQRITPPTDIPLKPPSAWSLAGQPVKRLDTKDKLTGALAYGVDFTAPGMLVAIPKACPVHGGKLVSFNPEAIAAMPGLRHVLKVDDETAAVVADSFWNAKTALDALPIVWDEGPNAQASSATIAAAMREGLSSETAFVGAAIGDAKQTLARAERVIEADYSFPYQNHAQMEVLCATVRWTPERCEVWGPTQVAEAALEVVANAAGVPIDACEIHPMRIGGSFGRRLAADYLRMAVLIAKQVPGLPIKMIWTREEDMAQGRFHPATHCRMRASLDEKGDLTALHLRIAGQSSTAYARPSAITDKGDPYIFQGLLADGAEGTFAYAAPNLLIDFAMRNAHIRTGYWRGVNANQNALYSECFIDELAHAAGQDPYAFRLKLMAGRPKHLAVLKAAAERAGWGAPAPAGVHRGMAQFMSFGSYTAAVAEVSVSDQGVVKVHRIVAATDPGHAVNPQQIAAQVEGSFAFGLSACLFGECTVRNGRVEQTNFDSFPPVRLEDMPQVETIVLPSGGFWGGVGEPTIAVAAPAVLNAIFAATGKRIRSIPLKAADLRRA